MKAIIEGKRYDTETAELVADWANNLGKGDFKNCYEGLHRTAKGSWFIYGYGGALTQYARSASGGGTCGGEAIRPLSAEEARSWLEQHRQTNALEQYFPDAIEDA